MSRRPRKKTLVIKTRSRHTHTDTVTRVELCGRRSCHARELSFETGRLIAGNVKFLRASVLPTLGRGRTHPRKPYDEIWRVVQEPINASHGLLLAAKTYTQLLHFILFRSVIRLLCCCWCCCSGCSCNCNCTLGRSVERARAYSSGLCGAAAANTKTVVVKFSKRREVQKQRAARRVFRRFSSSRSAALLFPPNVPCAECVFAELSL